MSSSTEDEQSNSLDFLFEYINSHLKQEVDADQLSTQDGVPEDTPMFSGGSTTPNPQSWQEDFARAGPSQRRGCPQNNNSNVNVCLQINQLCPVLSNSSNPREDINDVTCWEDFVEPLVKQPKKQKDAPTKQSAEQFFQAFRNHHHHGNQTSQRLPTSSQSSSQVFQNNHHSNQDNQSLPVSSRAGQSSQLFQNNHHSNQDNQSILASTRAGQSSSQLFRNNHHLNQNNQSFPASSRAGQSSSQLFQSNHHWNQNNQSFPASTRAGQSSSQLFQNNHYSNQNNQSLPQVHNNHQINLNAHSDQQVPMMVPNNRVNRAVVENERLLDMTNDNVRRFITAFQLNKMYKTNQQIQRILASSVPRRPRQVGRSTATGGVQRLTLLYQSETPTLPILPPELPHRLTFLAEQPPHPFSEDDEEMRQDIPASQHLRPFFRRKPAIDSLDTMVRTFARDVTPRHTERQPPQSNGSRQSIQKKTPHAKKK